MRGPSAASLRRPAAAARPRWPRSGSGCGTSSPSTRRPPGWRASSAPPTCPGDLVRGRQIAVLAAVTDAAEAGRLASALLDQRLRPAEVIAATPTPHGAGGARGAGQADRPRHPRRRHVGRVGAARRRPGPRLDPPAGPAGQRALAGAVDRLAGDADAGAAGQPGTCSTWPARGSARRRTRSGSAPASTSSPTGWKSPRSSRPPCWPPAARRPGTGAATGCGCSRSPLNAIFTERSDTHWPDPDQARWSTVTST